MQDLLPIATRIGERLKARGETIAVAESLTADQVANAFTVYPSNSGSVAEAARRLHHPAT